MIVSCGVGFILLMFGESWFNRFQRSITPTLVWKFFRLKDRSIAALRGASMFEEAIERIQLEKKLEQVITEKE
jgi:hypothetical protein